MNKKLFALLMSVIFIVTVMSGTVAFAGASVDNENLITDVNNITNTHYQNQTLKSIIAFFTDDHEATAPESFEDVIILDTNTDIQESYPITIPADHKDYILIIFNGVDDVAVRTVVVLPHEHIPGGWVQTDEQHWRTCDKYGCNEKIGTGEHQLPLETDTDCTTPVLCECGYIMIAGAESHTYTNNLDSSCNNEGCNHIRTAVSPSVTFDANGGNALENNVFITTAEGKLNQLPVPTRNGWNFEGWYTSSVGGTKVIENSTVFVEDCTVYAHWKSIYLGSGSMGSSGSGGGGGGVFVGTPTYTISFATNGGTTVSSATGTKDVVLYLGDYVTSKEGYTFAGWCSDAQCNNPVDSLTLKGNTTVYAKWLPIENQPADDIASNIHFSDVNESDWYYDAVNFVTENKIMNGVGETDFAPHNTTTRAMLVTMLYRMDGEPETSAQNDFSDVSKDAYYEKAVIWAKEKGIVNGYENGSFGTDDEVTREQLASILYRYAEHKGYDANYEDTNILSFNDAFEISEYAYPALAWACKNGIINGDGNKLMPLGSAERCQVAAMLMRFCEMIKK